MTRTEESWSFATESSWARKRSRAVDQRDGTGDALEVEGPVAGAVPTADDQDVLVAHDLELADEVHEPAVLEVLGVRERPRREGPDAARDQHRLGVDLDALVGPDQEAAVLLLHQRLGTVAEEVGRVVGGGLLDAALDEVLPLDGGEPGDVVDLLLGVERGDLPAGLGQRVQDGGGQPAEAGVVRRVEAGWPCSDDAEIDLVTFHASLFGCGDWGVGPRHRRASDLRRPKRPER
jgi:hypothetical protein